MTVHDAKLSRRLALQGFGALVIGLHLSRESHAQSGAASAFKGDSAAGVFAPNAYLRVAPDNTITVLVKHIEFGQGPFTGLATLVAEEMDADWAQMRAEHAPSNPEFYKNLAFGVQGTGGSTAIANSFDQMRKAGAAARAMLVQAAAQEWGVSAADVTVERGLMRHAASGRSSGFGAFADAAAKLPVPENPPLKDPSRFALIGREGAVKKLDTVDKATGRAQFTIDVREPDMLTVVVAHPPRFGGKVGTFDAAAALKVPGVVDVKAISSGVAVYARSTWPAMQGRKALTVQWDDSGAETRSTAQLVGEYRALARSPGQLAGSNGDALAALARGGERVIESEYLFPYLAHAPMEPLDGIVNWDGQKALVRFGSQFQTIEQMTIAKVLGIPPENVELRTLLAGGSFGRRAQSTMHFAAEMAEVAKAIGPNRPVKLIWTREDDIRGGYYRGMMLHRLRGLVRDGKIAAWSNTVVGQSIAEGTAMTGMLVKDGIDTTSVEGSRELLYDIADFRCDLHSPKVGVPVLWWRSVGHSHTGYAVECFVDELLVASGKDPVAGRLEMMAKEPRAAGVLRAVAQRAGWGTYQPPAGRGLGVAVVESFKSFVAQIAEVSMEPDGPRVHKVWCAVDCGIAVNPDVIRAQMEGGIGFGLGHALYGEITLENGGAVQSNFNDYRSLRIHEMPEVDVTIIASTEAPTGVGEPGVPPIGPAVANALAKLGHPRPRRLPMVGGTV